MLLLIKLMMQKKHLKFSSVLLIGLLLIFISGCAQKDLINDPVSGEIIILENSSKLQDGSYKAATRYYDARGYKQELTLTVREGIITQTNFIEVSKNKTLRNQVPEELNPWEGSRNLTLEDIYSLLYTKLIFSQNPEKIDNISGATQTSQRFIDLSQAAFDQSLLGNTEPAFILTNDTYIIKSSIDQQGFQGILTAVYSKDLLTTLSYDEVNINDGKSKSKLTEAETPLNFKVLFKELTSQTIASQNLNPAFPETELNPEKFKYQETLTLLKELRDLI